MKTRVLLALLCLGLAQGSFGFSLKDALKEVADAALASQPATEADKTAQTESSAATQLNEPPAKGSGFQAKPDNALMKQGMWQDPRTGLIWSRCEVGMTWSGTACEGKIANFFTLDEAMLGASQFKLGGNNDWRVPTLDEISSVRNCGEESELSDMMGAQEFPGDDGTMKRSLNVCSSGRAASIATDEIFPTGSSASYGEMTWLLSPKPDENWLLISNKLMRMESGGAFRAQAKLMAVRGGKPAETYAKRLAQAQARIGQQVAAKKGEEQAKQQQAAEYDRKTKELRKTVKAGDRISQGLVLAVKGELVQVQTYERVCASKTGLTCWRYEVVVSGEKWIRRDEVRPIVPISK